MYINWYLIHEYSKRAVGVQQQAQEEGRARKEISARMKTTSREACVRKSARAWKLQEDVKRIDVWYIDGYIECNK